MKKQRKQLLILVIVLLLLVAGYFGVQKYNEAQSKKTSQDTAEYAIDLPDSDVTELSYTYEGEEYAFIREEGTWKYKEDKALSVMQSRINTMVSNVAKLEIQGQIDNVTDLSEYGLDEPERVITFVAGGTSYEIAVGDFNSVTALDYINIDNSNVVYAAEAAFSDAFDYTLEELLEEETEEPTDESAEEMSDEVSGESAEEVTAESAGESAEEVTAESADESTKEVTAESTDESAEEVTDESTGETTEGTESNTAEKAQDTVESNESTATE